MKAFSHAQISSSCNLTDFFLFVHLLAPFSRDCFSYVELFIENMFNDFFGSRSLEKNGALSRIYYV